MNLENAYRIELTNIKTLHNKTVTGVLIQYVEAENMDEAIKKAKNTFHARLHGFETTNGGSTAQKACLISPVRESLRFGFSGGWVTIHPDGNKTIFDMLKEAEKRDDWTKGGKISEIETLLVNGETR